MTTANDGRDQVTFSIAARIVVGLAGLLLVGLLVVLFAVLGTLKDTRTQVTGARAIADRTDAKLKRLSAGLDPLVSATAPFDSPGARRSVRLRRAWRPQQWG